MKGTKSMTKERELKMETIAILAQMFENSKDKSLIAEDESYKLLKPRNSWEMNYRLVSKHYKITYLIDVDDFSEIENIKDFDEVIDHAWKAIEE